MIDTTLAALRARTPNARRFLIALFGSTQSRSVVAARLIAIRRQLDVFAAPDRHVCHATQPPAPYCRGGAAQISPEPTGSTLVLCPDFLAEDREEQARILIHEAAHAAPSVAAVDTAQPGQRLTTLLEPAQALRNADHYRLLVSNVVSPGSAPIGPVESDHYPSLALARQRAAQFTLAYVEDHLIHDQGKLVQVIDILQEVLGTLGPRAVALRDPVQIGFVAAFSRRYGTPADPARITATQLRRLTTVMAEVAAQIVDLARLIRGVQRFSTRRRDALGGWHLSVEFFQASQRMRNQLLLDQIAARAGLPGDRRAPLVQVVEDLAGLLDRPGATR